MSLGARSRCWRCARPACRSARPQRRAWPARRSWTPPEDSGTRRWAHTPGGCERRRSGKPFAVRIEDDPGGGDRVLAGHPDRGEEHAEILGRAQRAVLVTEDHPVVAADDEPVEAGGDCQIWRVTDRG